MNLSTKDKTYNCLFHHSNTQHLNGHTTYVYKEPQQELVDFRFLQAELVL